MEWSAAVNRSAAERIAAEEALLRKAGKADKMVQQRNTVRKAVMELERMRKLQSKRGMCKSLYMRTAGDE